jgi:thiosulfate dehydrogenase
MKRISMLKGTVVAAVAAGLTLASGALAQQKELTVAPCDGGAPVKVEGFREGERLSKERAQVLADTLMDGWLARQDPFVAAAWVTEREAALTGSMQAASSGPRSGTGEQPTDITHRDRMVWERELSREVAYGDKLFHDDKEIGSPEGVSCAMCHPHGSNTHPETYPKFQQQLKKVALLRDMINWCIENPVRGKKLDADDPKMRALEAYILSQRKGAQIEPGKH